MTLNQSYEYICEHTTPLLGMLDELRLAVYRHSVSYRMPTDTLDHARAAENAQARAGLAADAAYQCLYSLLTAGIDDIINREEAEAREAKGEAVGTSH